MEQLASLIKPGDVLVINTADLAGELIRFGAAFVGKPNIENHVAVLHHQNPDGTWRAIEARPGGVGWTDATHYLTSHWTLSNVGQPKNDLQRIGVCKIVEQMLGTSYDWEAIAQDALNDLHIPDVWAEQWNNQTPDHVVCSSLATWAYDKMHMPAPTPADPSHCQPADWTEFILANGYQNAPGAV